LKVNFWSIFVRQRNFYSTVLSNKIMQLITKHISNIDPDPHKAEGQGKNNENNGKNPIIP
jgi:hypothetical protein